MTAVAWVFGLFGALAMLLALSRLAAGRRMVAAWHAALSAVLVAAAMVLGTHLFFTRALFVPLPVGPLTFLG